MQILEEKRLPAMPQESDPGSMAREIFEGYNFAGLEVLDFDGAESVVQPGSNFAESSIRFYVSPESGTGDSVPMLFRVFFLENSTIVTVYG